jgi:hypothetical protein
LKKLQKLAKLEHADINLKIAAKCGPQKVNDIKIHTPVGGCVRANASDVAHIGSDGSRVGGSSATGVGIDRRVDGCFVAHDECLSLFLIF